MRRGTPTYQQQQYNIFKSYGNAKNRPAQYAAQHRVHATSEYLDPLQIKMLQYRKGPDNPKVMFTNPWSGFNKAQNANQGELIPVGATAPIKGQPGYRRRLREVTSVLQEPAQGSIRRIGVPLDISSKNMEESPSKEDQQEASFEKISFLMFSVVVMMLLGIVMFLGYGRIRRDKHGSRQQHHQESSESTNSSDDDDMERRVHNQKNRELIESQVDSTAFGGVLTTAAAVVFTV